MRQILPLLLLSISGCVTVETNPRPELNTSDIERSEARIALGLGYLEQGRMVKARENLEIALDHSPTYYRAQISMAHYYERVGEQSAADMMYSRAVRQHPDNGNVLNNYGTFLCKQGEYERADSYFNKAIKQPYYYLISTSYENAALCSVKAGNTDKAQHYFERTLAHDPNRQRAILHLAKLEIDSGQYKQARLRLMQYHQRFGVKKASLKLLADLEEKAGNSALEQKYRTKLEQMT